MLVPIVLFVYKRLEHTKQTIESLSENIMSKQTDLFIFSDAEKNAIEKEKVVSVRQYIHQLDWQKKFRHVTIIETAENKGLANSIIDGVTQIFEMYRKVIVLEDDIVVSKNFLQYMNDALGFYENSSNVWSISGYTLPMKSLVKYPHDVYYGYRGCSWGWGTWKDRWEKVDWDVLVYNDFIHNRKWKKKFNRGGSDMTPMLKNQMEGKLDSWAIRWCFTQSNLDMFTVYPKESLVKNIGCDGTGTHCGNDKSSDTMLTDEIHKYKFEELSINRKIEKEFWKKYSDTLDKKIKRKLKKVFNSLFK